MSKGKIVEVNHLKGLAHEPNPWKMVIATKTKQDMVINWTSPNKQTIFDVFAICIK